MTPRPDTAAYADAAVARGARRNAPIALDLGLGLLVSMALAAAYRHGLAQATKAADQHHEGRPCAGCAERAVERAAAFNGRATALEDELAGDVEAVEARPTPPSQEEGAPDGR